VFEIGAELAAARRTRGLSLADAEALTCIRGRHLAALEAEQFDQLPGRAYARGFLRSYARALDLDAAVFVAEFDERYPEPAEDAAPPMRRRRHRRRRRRLALPVGFAAVAATAVVLLILGWSASGPSPETPLAVKAVKHQARRPTHAVVGHRDRRAVDRRLVIRATRGDCWLLVRRGGQTGPVLYEGTLRHGSIVRFAAPHVWVRLGAPQSVDVQRAGSRVTGLPATPTDIVA
jgi:cytoskeleton protein RodZ